MSKYTAIPDFDLTPASMNTALRAIKNTLNILCGLQRGEPLGAPNQFVQPNVPVTPARELKIGDLWIDTSLDKLNYWNGSQWRRL